MLRPAISLMAFLALLGCSSEHEPAGPAGPDAAAEPAQGSEAPEFEFDATGKLHFVLTGLMGEFRMGDGAPLGPQSPNIRIAAFLVRDGVLYQLRFSDDTVFEGDASGDGIPLRQVGLLHPGSEYRIAGRFGRGRDSSYFFPVGLEKVWTDVSYGNLIMRGNGVPYKHSPVVARDLLVERMETVSAGSGEFSLHLAIRRVYVFGELLAVGLRDAETLSVAGECRVWEAPAWAADGTTDPASLRAIVAETDDDAVRKIASDRLEEG